MGLKNINFTLILFSCLFITSLLFVVNANEPEVEDESSFSYVVGAENGPQNWGNLNTSWTLCGTGKSQSPINILDYRVVVWPSLGDLNRTYKPAPALIKNRGHDIEVEWTGDAGGIIINGTEFKLQQCHWHIPSEHTVNGARFNMELHIVHSNSQGDIAVVGILYNFHHIWNRPIVKELIWGLLIHRVSSLKEENITDIMVLLHPPCSENVTWTVFKTVRTVSAQQIKALRDAVHDLIYFISGKYGKCKAIQPLNERPVTCFDQDPILNFGNSRRRIK
ncbi:hypothetical protein Pfo_028277 [Paulownia fortunei]|nr:hypothetical protein Pfo_028277 [Paulownia fortunei]